MIKAYKYTCYICEFMDGYTETTVYIPDYNITISTDTRKEGISIKSENLDGIKETFNNSKYFKEIEIPQEDVEQLKEFIALRRVVKKKISGFL